MKSINDIRVHMTELSETTDDAEMRKLSTLVRSGLFDAKKLTLLKRALNKDNLKMTKAERDTLLELLDKLLNVVTTNQGVFQKVKQSVSEDLVLEDYEFSMARSQLKTIIRDAEALLDEIQGEGEMESWMQSKITLAADYIGAVADNVVSGESEIKKIKEDYEEISLEEAKELVSVDVNQMPAMLILKRRAIRVFPDGQKVALYYSDRLKKFVTVPFSSFGLSEETLEERNVDWAWEQGYRKRHAAANDDTLSPAERANAAAELARYHAMTTSRFGKPAATSLQSTFDKAQGQAQAAKAAAKARAKAMADRGLSDKMARRAAKQGEIRDTLKSTIPGTFGKAYRATGSLAGAAGIALGLASRKAGLKTLSTVRKLNIKESFGENLQHVREQAALQLYSPTATKPLEMPKNFNPLSVNQYGSSSSSKLNPANAPGLGLPATFLGLGAATATALSKPDFTPPQKPAKPRPPKPQEIDIPNFTEPVVQPKTAPDITPAQQPAIQPAPAIVAAPAAATLAKTATEPAAETNAQPRGRTKSPRPKTRERARLRAGLPDANLNIQPWDISAGKGKKGNVPAEKGLNPFDAQVGKGGPYGTPALSQIVGKTQRKAFGVNEEADANTEPEKATTSSSTWDITAPQPTAREKLANVQGKNPFTGDRVGGVYDTPAVARSVMQKQLRAMTQSEGVLAELQNMISENIESKELQIGEEYITINNGMAKKIVHVYESVNKINKVKMEKMLNENVDSFTKVLQFATKN